MRLPPLRFTWPLGALALALPAGPAVAQTPTYRVYPPPVESPLHTTPPPPADARVLVTDPSDAAASPYGWHDTDGAPGAEFTATQGNNVAAFLDADGDHVPDPGETADGGAALAFDFPLDLSNPGASREARLAEVFYWANVFHDVLYRYGFTEAAGNFQQNSYGRGGTGGDALRLELGAGSGGGSTSSTPPDGSPPRVTIGGYNIPGRDAAFDNGVVVHELAHGLSNRLTGGPSTVSCLNNAEQMGEGWSDFYALMLTMRPADTRTAPRALGTYLLGDAPGGPGIRPAPYSTDFAVNDYTYQRTRTATVPHDVGFIWATILWEVTWDLIDAYGFDLARAGGPAGNVLMLNLVTTGLKLQPCSPGFVTGRDAVLAADALLYGGAHAARLWTAFARRGLGFSASQGSSNTNADNTEAFDLPPFVAAESGASVPALTLEAPAPNPVVDAGRVAFTLPTAGPVRLALYDLTGRAVAVLADEARAAGSHTLAFDVRGLAAGPYVLRLEAAGTVATRRVVVAR